MLKKAWAKTVEFLSEVRAELKKVSYPTVSETIGSTTVVLLFCLFMSLYLSIIDSVLVWVISKIL